MDDEKDAAELVRLMRIYLPQVVLPQMLGDLERSRSADRDPELRRLFRVLRKAAS